MQCPVCNVALNITERQGIEIDYCPQCRGVWLDRGELDKLIERSQAQTQTPLAAYTTPPQQRPPEPRHVEPRRYYEDEDDYKRYGGDYRRKKRGGFLGEIFDFD